MFNKIWLWLRSAFIAILLTACAVQPQVPVTGDGEYEPALSPAGVVESYSCGWDAEVVSAEAIETSLPLLAADATLEISGVQPGISETIQGKDQIETYLRDLVKAHVRIKRQVEWSEKDVVSAHSLYWTDSLRGLGVAPLAVEEEFTIRNGQISRITWAPTQESGRRLVTAMTSEEAPPAAEMPAAPGGRMWHTLAYIPEQDQVLLFGGGRFADAWLYQGDGTLWSVLPVRRVPTIERVGGLRGAYDTAAKRLIVPVYEGEGVPLETWAFDPQSGIWENLNPVNPPVGRRFADLVYDAGANKSVLFGGVIKEDYSQISAETWLFDYPSRAWTRMEPEQSPPATYYHMSAYDADPGRVLVWGGEPMSEEQVIWSYETSANRWSKIEYTNGPQQNYDGVMTYAAALDQVFLYVRTQFWAYDDNANQWTQLDPSPAPGMRLAAGMAYDEGRRHLILYGGTTPDSNVYAYGPHDGQWDINLP